MLGARLLNRLGGRAGFGIKTRGATLTPRWRRPAGCRPRAHFGLVGLEGLVLASRARARARRAALSGEPELLELRPSTSRSSVAWPSRAVLDMEPSWGAAVTAQQPREPRVRGGGGGAGVA